MPKDVKIVLKMESQTDQSVLISYSPQQDLLEELFSQEALGVMRGLLDCSVIAKAPTRGSKIVIVVKIVVFMMNSYKRVLMNVEKRRLEESEGLDVAKKRRRRTRMKQQYTSKECR